MGSTYSQFFPPKPLYSVQDIPDLTGKVVIVTGATSGIGKETAKASPSPSSYIDMSMLLTVPILVMQALLAHNAKVYIAARNKQKIEAAIKDLQAETGKEAIALHLDLADLKSVKAAVEQFLRCVCPLQVRGKHLFDVLLTYAFSKEKELHILFNNGYVPNLCTSLHMHI